MSIRNNSYLLLIVVLFIWLTGGFRPDQGFDGRLKNIVQDYRFSVVKWEMNTLFGEAAKLFNGVYRSPVDSAKVLEYLASVDKARSLRPQLASIMTGDRQGDGDAVFEELEQVNRQQEALVAGAESVLQRQIRSVLESQGIYNPLYAYTRLKVGFPPVSFKLEEPVALLVVSKRDKIGMYKQVLLKQSLSLEAMEKIEREVDGFDLSSLVVELGGFAGTYPTFVANRGDIRFTINAAVEEWAHQYLSFKPLGFRYILSLTGLRPDKGIAILNETVAGMVADEIGRLVYKEYYEQYDKKTPRPPVKSEINFNEEMRNIRKQVDFYLAAGLTGQAEQFMEQKRQYLATKGYYIRKLNQAYFTFYGNYTSAPGTVSPIGGQFAELRARSDSLADFLNKAGSITSAEQLGEMIR